MKSLYRSALCCVLLLMSCNKEKDTENLPACITQKIEAIKTETVRNPPAKIYRYSYQNKTVFFIPQYCCDVFSELYNENCTLICHPDGGITGMGDGKCSDFFTERKEERLVWEDKRWNRYIQYSSVGFLSAESL